MLTVACKTRSQLSAGQRLLMPNTSEQKKYLVKYIHLDALFPYYIALILWDVDT